MQKGKPYLKWLWVLNLFISTMMLEKDLYYKHHYWSGFWGFFWLLSMFAVFVHCRINSEREEG